MNGSAVDGGNVLENNLSDWRVRTVNNGGTQSEGGDWETLVISSAAGDYPIERPARSIIRWENDRTLDDDHSGPPLSLRRFSGKIFKDELPTITGLFT